jgi:hypothetical protein
MILDDKKAVNEEGFRVVHPLDDVREEKLDPKGLGPMRLTRSVRFSLLMLRGYLVAMALLVAYHVLELGGVV